MSHEEINISPINRGQGIESADFYLIRKPFTQFQTWLGETKGTEGCPVNCQYCFFKLDGQTPRIPSTHLSPKDVVDHLEDTYTYHPSMPINFGSQTDVFATKNNIAYYSEVLNRLNETDYKNPIIFITKRSIPESFIRLASKAKQPILFYMSYSGLAGTPLEPTVSSNQIRENFVKLKQYGLPAIHYWRPFTPQNSNKDSITHILDHVARYATCSVVNGLRLNDGIRDNILPFWPELGMQNYDFKKSGEFWPEGVRNYLKIVLERDYPTYPVFFGNTPCTVTYALETSDISGIYNGRMCKDSQCQPKQRDCCFINHRQPDTQDIERAIQKMEIDPDQVQVDNDKIIINGPIDTGKIVYLKTALRFPVLTGNIIYEGGHNWANVNEETSVVEVPWKDNWIYAQRYFSHINVDRGNASAKYKERLHEYPLKTIVLAGGRGKRLEQITKGIIPKCFVELDPNTGIRGIDYLEDMFSALALDSHNIVISADYYYRHYENEIVNKRLGYTMLLQKENIGNGGAIEQAINEYGFGFQYLVISPDTYFAPDDLAKLIREHIPGTISWGVSRAINSMEGYYGLVVDKTTNAVLGDTKLPWWKDYPLDNAELVVKGAVQIFDPHVFMRSTEVFKRLSHKQYPLDLYWDICPLIEEENRRKLLRGKPSILQATYFDHDIIDYGVPERLEIIRNRYKYV